MGQTRTRSCQTNCDGVSDKNETQSCNLPACQDCTTVIASETTAIHGASLVCDSGYTLTDSSATCDNGSFTASNACKQDCTTVIAGETTAIHGASLVCDSGYT